MAFLHCHTKNCGWSQDDFWDIKFRIKWKSYKKSWWKLGFSIGYNPISKVSNDIAWLWKPRWMSLDEWIINDITKYTGVDIKRRRIKKTRKYNSNDKLTQTDQHGVPMYISHPTYYETQVFSWQWLWLELIREWKNIKRMKWWTYDSWKKDMDTAVCPKCGKRNFDID